MRYLLILLLLLFAAPALAQDGFIFDSRGNASYYHQNRDGSFIIMEPSGETTFGFEQDGNYFIMDSGEPDAWDNSDSDDLDSDEDEW